MGKQKILISDVQFSNVYFVINYWRELRGYHRPFGRPIIPVEINLNNVLQNQIFNLRLIPRSIFVITLLISVFNLETSRKSNQINVSQI